MYIVKLIEADSRMQVSKGWEQGEMGRCGSSAQDFNHIR